MSPNKQENKDENYQFNENNNQFINQFQDQSDDEHILNNGYTLLNQDQDQNQLNDESSEYSSDSDEDNQLNNDKINIINLDDDGNIINDNKLEENDSRLKSYLNNQLDEINFEREWDKKEENKDQLNSINLDGDNIDKIKEIMKEIKLPTPDWVNKISESNLTNFIYKRLASDKD